MTIEYTVEGKAILPSHLLQKIANSISAASLAGNHSPNKKYRIGLSLVDEQTSRQLNLKYAKHDYPTDVLSFVYDDQTKGNNDGDLAICKPIAQKQADEFGVVVESEIALLVVHGTLHILGYDHQNANQSASMDKLQGDIMEELNFKYRDFKWSH